MPTGRASCWTIPTRRSDCGHCACCTPTGSLTRSMRDKLVALARTEPDAEVRSELANTAARLEPDDALAVLQELMRRQEDLSDKHIPLRIWWALEDQHHARRGLGAELARRSRALAGAAVHAHIWPAASPGGWLPTVATPPGSRASIPTPTGRTTRDTRAVLMPGGKGDYTDWETNYTPEVSDRNLTRAGAAAGDGAAVNLRDRLLGRRHSRPRSGRAPGTHSRASRHDPRSAERGPISRRGRGHGGARPGGVPDPLRAMPSDRRQRHGASRAAAARLPVGARIGRPAHPNRAARTEGTSS